MASPLASTSRNMLSNESRQLLRLAGGVNRSYKVNQRTLSTTSTNCQEEILQDGRDQPTGEGAFPSAAAQKAYYDNLKANERQATIDEERNKLHLRQARLRNLADLGSTQTRENSFRPHVGRLNPITAKELTVSHLIAATAHVGHAKSSLDRASSAFVYGTRNGQTIIDVEKYTLPALRLACKVVKGTVYRDGVVVFLGTAEGTESAIIAAAKRLGKNGFHVTGRWLPGTLSNAPKVLGRAILANVDDYEEQLKEEQNEQNSRKRSNQGSRRFSAQDDEVQIDPLNLATQKLKPDLIVVLNPKSNLYAINEATQAGVPTIGVIDTDVDPRMVTYAIPANDESVRTCELIVGLLSKAGQEGLEDRKKFLDEQSKRQSKAMRESRKAPNRKVAENSEGEKE